MDFHNARLECQSPGGKLLKAKSRYAKYSCAQQLQIFALGISCRFAEFVMLYSRFFELIVNVRRARK